MIDNLKEKSITKISSVYKLYNLLNDDPIVINYNDYISYGLNVKNNDELIEEFSENSEIYFSCIIIGNQKNLKDFISFCNENNHFENIYYASTEIFISCMINFPILKEDNYYDSKPAIICKNLYVGKAFQLRKENIQKHFSTIINVTENTFLDISNDKKYYHYPMKDEDDFSIMEYVDEIYEKISSCLNEDKNCVVFCDKGSSRSVSMIVYFLCKKNNMKVNEAISYIKSLYSNVNINSGFIEQLNEFFH